MKTGVRYALVFSAALAASGTAQAAGWETIVTLIKTLMSEASAWAGTVMQTALSGKQKSEGVVNTQQMLGNSMAALSTYARTMKAALDFHPAVGQPSSIKCAVQTERKFLVESSVQSQRDAAHLMETFSAGRVDSRVGAQSASWTMHRDQYCTLTEAQQGLCTLNANGMQGWDSDYGATFGERTLAPEGELAAYAYAAKLTDARPPVDVDCRSSACVSASLAQLERSAQASMAAAALVRQTTDRRVPVLTGR